MGSTQSNSSYTMDSAYSLVLWFVAVSTGILSGLFPLVYMYIATASWYIRLAIILWVLMFDYNIAKHVHVLVQAIL